MELDRFISFAKQRRIENGGEILEQKKPLRTFKNPKKVLDEGLRQVADHMELHGESLVQEWHYMRQPKKVREQVEEPYVDLERLDKTRPGTVAIHQDEERVAAIINAANPGSDLNTLKQFAHFTNGFHFVPKKDDAA